MIKIMRVKSAAQVEGSKNLRVYTFEAPESDDLTIVANLTNIYEVGDTAAVAQVGTHIKKYNLTIERRKVFGIESEGMALGHVEIGDSPIFVDLEVGSELDDEFVSSFI